MATFADTLIDIRRQLLDAAEEARQAAVDSGTDDSVWWDIATELDIAHESVDASCDAVPEED